MVIIVRIDLDKYDLGKLRDLVRDRVVTIPEAREAKSFKALDEYAQLMTVRAWQEMMQHQEKEDI